mmetsp:Transcript_4536/g.14838  ORF Transcript_4536/g.14838 Transcript_4536/m.14838 type:complete len:274 (+) Transcript_4536:849-1670(+)
MAKIIPANSGIVVTLVDKYSSMRTRNAPERSLKRVCVDKQFARIGNSSKSFIDHFARVGFFDSVLTTTGALPTNPRINASSHSRLTSSRAESSLVGVRLDDETNVDPRIKSCTFKATASFANAHTAKPRCNLSLSRRVFGRHGPNVATIGLSSIAVETSTPPFVSSAFKCASSAVASSHGSTSMGKLPNIIFTQSGCVTRTSDALVDAVPASCSDHERTALMSALSTSAALKASMRSLMDGPRGGAMAAAALRASTACARKKRFSPMVRRGRV